MSRLAIGNYRVDQTLIIYAVSLGQVLGGFVDANRSYK